MEEALRGRVSQIEDLDPEEKPSRVIVHIVSVLPDANLLNRADVGRRGDQEQICCAALEERPPLVPEVDLRREAGSA